MKTIFLAKERANGSPKAVRIVFSKISKHMIPSTTLFLHPKHAGEKVLGAEGRATARKRSTVKTFSRSWALWGPRKLLPLTLESFKLNESSRNCVALWPHFQLGSLIKQIAKNSSFTTFQGGRKNSIFQRCNFCAGLEEFLGLVIRKVS